MQRKLRMGMIGGSTGAFIGGVHRIAAAMDGYIELVCGAFSSDPAKSKETGINLFLNENRVYANFEEMIKAEKERPDTERMDFVSIVTPNHMHFAPAKMALENGFDVVLDKPITLTLDEAKELKQIIEKTGRTFCLTHTYTGYPMVKEARHIVASGALGKITKVYATYPQGWLSQFLESTEHKQASWRTDPSKSGKAGSMGDIGTHAFNLAEYVSGLQVAAVCAQINTVVEGRKLDDDGTVMLQFNNGATGVITVSQVAAGEENNVRIAVYGDKGGLYWQQESNNELEIKWSDKPKEIRTAGNDYLSDIAKHNCRTPAGHPEGYLEAFANLYRNFALTVDARRNGETPHEFWTDFPGAEDGVRGMAFIDHVIASGTADKKWIDFTI